MFVIIIPHSLSQFNNSSSWAHRLFLVGVTAVSLPRGQIGPPRQQHTHFLMAFSSETRQNTSELFHKQPAGKSGLHQKKKKKHITLAKCLSRGVLEIVFGAQWIVDGYSGVQTHRQKHTHTKAEIGGCFKVTEFILFFGSNKTHLNRSPVKC